MSKTGDRNLGNLLCRLDVGDDYLTSYRLSSKKYLIASLEVLQQFGLAYAKYHSHRRHSQCGNGVMFDCQLASLNIDPPHFPSCHRHACRGRGGCGSRIRVVRVVPSGKCAICTKDSGYN